MVPTHPRRTHLPRSGGAEMISLLQHTTLQTLRFRAGCLLLVLCLLSRSNAALSQPSATKLLEKTQAYEAPLKLSIEGELNSMAALQDVSWKKSIDGITLVRNNRWYRDDYLEAPVELIQKLLKEELIQDPKRSLQETQKPDPLKKPIYDSILRKRMDRIAEMALKLSPWQIAFGLRYSLPSQQDSLSESIKAVVANREIEVKGVIDQSDPSVKFDRRPTGSGFPFYDDSSYALNHYRTNLFYASLSTEHRDLLLANKLPWEKLNVQQRETAAYILPRLELMQRQGEDLSLVQLGMGVNSRDTRAIIGKLVVTNSPPDQ